MRKIAIIILIGILICIISTSGCIETTKVNNTCGEKKISIDAIKVSNDTIGNHSEQNESIYYVRGYILNQNPYEALNANITVTTYYSNGTVFAVNDTPFLDPKNLPANGKSRLFARFEDPDKKIAKFEVKILSAKSEY